MSNAKSPARRSNAPRPRQAEMSLFAGVKQPTGGADASIAKPTPVNGGPTTPSPERPGDIDNTTTSKAEATHEVVLGEGQAVDEAPARAIQPGSAGIARADDAAKGTPDGHQLCTGPGGGDGLPAGAGDGHSEQPRLTAAATTDTDAGGAPAGAGQWGRVEPPAARATNPGVARAVGIFELTKGITITCWLCQFHLDIRTTTKPLPDAPEHRTGWAAKRIGDVDQDCDDCSLATQPDTSGMVFPAPRRVVSVGDAVEESTEAA